MSEGLWVWIDEQPLRVVPGTTVAAAILLSGRTAFRRSVSGEARGPLCGMGICFECRVAIDNVEHCRSCQIVCRDGMQVRTS